MTIFFRLTIGFARTFMMLLCMQPMATATTSPLSFKSLDELLIAHGNKIQTLHIPSQKLTKIVEFSQSVTFDSIAYNERGRNIWATTRHGIADGGTYNNLLIIPEDDPEKFGHWLSEAYWPHWNHCAHIHLAPNGDRMITIKTHEQTRRGNIQETEQWVHENFQELALLPADFDTHQEIAFDQSDPVFCGDAQAIRSAETTTDTNTVLINCHKGKVFLWYPTTRETTALNDYQPGYLNFGTLSNDGHWTFIASHTTGKLLFTGNPEIKPAMSFGCNATTTIAGLIDQAHFSTDNKHLLIVSHEPREYRNATTYSLLIFNLETLTVETTIAYKFVVEKNKERPDATIEEVITPDFSFEYPFATCTLSPDGKTIAALSNRGQLRIINTETHTIDIQQL